MLALLYVYMALMIEKRMRSWMSGHTVYVFMCLKRKEEELETAQERERSRLCWRGVIYNLAVLTQRGTLLNDLQHVPYYIIFINHPKE